VSKKGDLSDYDTPIAELLHTNRSRRSEHKMRKHHKKASRKKTRRGEKKSTSSNSTNDNNQGEFMYCCSAPHVSF